MIFAYILDENNIEIDYREIEKEEQSILNWTTLTKVGVTGKYKWKLDKVNNCWVEGATPQEIAEWEEVNKPKPQEPNKTEILEQEVSRLEIEMLKMKKGMI